MKRKKNFLKILFLIFLIHNLYIIAQEVNEWEIQDDLVKDFVSDKEEGELFKESEVKTKKQKLQVKKDKKQEKKSKDKNFVEAENNKKEKVVNNEEFIELEDGNEKTEKIVVDEEFIKVGEKQDSEDWMEGEEFVEDKEYLKDEEMVEEDFINEDVDIPDKEHDKGKKLIDETEKYKMEEEKIVFKPLDPLQFFRKKYLSSEIDQMLKSTLYYRCQYFLNNIPSSKREVQHELTIKFEFNKNIGPFEVNIIPEINIDDFNANYEFYTFNHLDDNGEKRSSINLSEAYISAQFGDFDIALGKKIYAWGKAYGPNPTDNINPYDLMDPIEGFNIDNDRKIGVWSLFVKYYFQTIAFFEFPSLEVIFVPRFTRNREAISGSRWYLDLSEGLEIEENFPDHSIHNSQIAARLSSTIKGCDFSFSYYNGVQHSSIQRAIMDPFFTQVIGAEKFYDNVHILGFDFVTTYKSFRFFFEGIHCWSKHDKQDDYFYIILGGDWRYNSLFIKDDEITVISELFFNKIVTSEGHDPYVKAVEEELDDSGDRGLIFIIQYKLDQYWSFHLSTVTNFNENHDWTGDFQEIGVSYKLNLNLILGLKAQFFNGKASKDLYGVYRKNDTVFFTCDYAF